MHYLVSIDRSAESAAAIEAAAQRAEREDGKLTLVHAADAQVSSNGDDSGLVQEGMDAAVDRGQAVIEWGEQQLHSLNADVDADVHLISDTEHPVDDLADYVETEEFDGVFVGHRALAGRTEAVVGSFAKNLISQASVPVTVVPADD